MEIEQQKREWEEKRQAQMKEEEEARQLAEKDDGELLTYAREDALNKVNIKSDKKPHTISKQRNVNNKISRGKVINGMDKVGNGHAKEVQRKSESTPVRTLPPRRNTRYSGRRSFVSEDLQEEIKTPPPVIPRKSINRSTSISKQLLKTQIKSEITRLPSDVSVSKSAKTVTPDESDSECSLDVMIDSNDVNDTDSNSNEVLAHTETSRFDSSSRDGSTVLNDDDSMSGSGFRSTKKSSSASNASNSANTPRTLRSRGTVAINLWTLDDDSPILPPKRQKISSTKKIKPNKEEEEEEKLRADFGVKKCRVSVVDIVTPTILKPPEKTLPVKVNSKPQRKLFNVKNNHTLDGWLNKNSSDDSSNSEKVDENEKKIRPRRNTVLMNKTF